MFQPTPYPKHENLQSLREGHVFSSGELEYASSDIFRIWEKQAAKAHRTDRWQF